jgi:hypothetical protein
VFSAIDDFSDDIYRFKRLPYNSLSNSGIEGKRLILAWQANICEQLAQFFYG